MSTAEERKEMILSTAKAGKTVLISTHLRTYKIDAKTVARFEKAGVPLLKVSGNSLLMGSGKTYFSIDYCKITVVGR